MDDITFLHQQISDLNNENLQLKSDVAFLKGKVEVYERFLQMKGYIKTELKSEDEDDDNILLCGRKNIHYIHDVQGENEVLIPVIDDDEEVKNEQ